MKCIKAIKPLKNTEVGTINRIDNVEAEARVLSGYWKYVPKSEWKVVVKPTKQVEVVVPVESDNTTIAERQLKRKKSK